MTAQDPIQDRERRTTREETAMNDRPNDSSPLDGQHPVPLPTAEERVAHRTRSTRRVGRVRAVIAGGAVLTSLAGAGAIVAASQSTASTDSSTSTSAASTTSSSSSTSGSSTSSNLVTSGSGGTSNASTGGS